MKTSTSLRIIIGVFFMSAGFIKTKRLGKRVMPGAWEFAAKQFKGFDRALKDFPGRDSVKIGAAEAQELFGYIDLICGFLLVTGNMVGLASFILIVETLGLEYTLFIMKYPMQYQAILIGVIGGLLSICCGGTTKDKTD